MLAAGQIVVAGTSAGTAVMSGGSFNGQRTPMITNGDSFNAMQFGAFDLPAPEVGCDKDSSCSNGLAESHLTYSASGGRYGTDTVRRDPLALGQFGVASVP